MILANPFTTTTADHPGMKRLCCGRTRDFKSIIQLVTEGRSVVLFGERRIGKTLALWLLRDLFDGSIQAYQGSLWDRDLAEWIRNGDGATIGHLSGPFRCVFLNWQEVSPRNPRDVLRHLAQLLEVSDGVRLSMTDLCRRATGDKAGRLVILMDEMEELLEERFVDRGAIFEQLNAAIQNCDKVSFVLAGADHWVRSVKDGTSPIYGNCSPYFLSSPESRPLSAFLLEAPLEAYVGPERVRREIVASIMECTGGKPFYCQALAYEIANGRSVEEALRGAEHAFGPHLEDFFADPPEPGRQILQLLAHRSGMTERRIAHGLTISRQEVTRCLADFLALGKVRRERRGFALNGTLFERWGKANITKPTVRSRWPAFVQWVAVALLLGVAASVYIYSHPVEREFQRTAQGAGIVLVMKGSVEAGEVGHADLYIVARERSVGPLSIQAGHGVAQLWPLEGPRWEFAKLASGERSPKLRASFDVSPAASGSPVGFRLIVQRGEAIEFLVPLRRVPLKRYWALVSGLATVLAVIAKWDLITWVFRLLRKRSGDGERGS